MVVSSREGVRWWTAACLKLTRSLKGCRTDTPRAGLAMATFCFVPFRSFCQVTWEIDHHVVAPHCHSSILIAVFLEVGFTLQPSVPSDNTWWLPIGGYTGSDCHLAPRAPGHNGGRCQGHVCHGSCWRQENKQTFTFFLALFLIISVPLSPVSTLWFDQNRWKGHRWKDSNQG